MLPARSVSIKADADEEKAKSSLLRIFCASDDVHQGDITSVSLMFVVNAPLQTKTTRVDNRERIITFGVERKSFRAEESNLGVKSLKALFTMCSEDKKLTVKLITDNNHEANSTFGPSTALRFSELFTTPLSRSSKLPSSILQNEEGRENETSPFQVLRRPHASDEYGPRTPPRLATVTCLKKRRKRKTRSFSLIELTKRRLIKLVAAEDRNKAKPSSGRGEEGAIPPLHFSSSCE